MDMRPRSAAAESIVREIMSELLAARRDAFMRGLRTALHNANPDIPAESLSVYDAARDRRLPDLAREADAGAAKALAKAFDDAEVEAWRRLLDSDDAKLALSALRRLLPLADEAARSVLMTEGLALHRACAEELFKTLKR